MIPGFVILAYLLAGTWLAYHNQYWDTRTVRFIAWLKSVGKPKPKIVDYGGIPIWKGGKLTWRFPEFEDKDKISSHDHISSVFH